MAATIHIGVPDLRDLRADLDAVQIGLGRQVNKALATSAKPIAALARDLAPFDATHRGWRWNHPYPDPGHIRDNIKARGAAYGAAIVSTHPGGPVHEFGGSIAPRGKPIQIERTAYTQKAGATLGERVERDAMDALDELLDRHNL